MATPVSPLQYASSLQAWWSFTKGWNGDMGPNGPRWQPIAGNQTQWVFDGGVVGTAPDRRSVKISPSAFGYFSISSTTPQVAIDIAAAGQTFGGQTLVLVYRQTLGSNANAVAKIGPFASGLTLNLTATGVQWPISAWSNPSITTPKTAAGVRAIAFYYPSGLQSVMAAWAGSSSPIPFATTLPMAVHMLLRWIQVEAGGPTIELFDALVFNGVPSELQGLMQYLVDGVFPPIPTIAAGKTIGLGVATATAKAFVGLRGLLTGKGSFKATAKVLRSVALGGTIRGRAQTAGILRAVGDCRGLAKGQATTSGWVWPLPKLLDGWIYGSSSLKAVLAGVAYEFPPLARQAASSQVLADGRLVLGHLDASATDWMGAGDTILVEQFMPSVGGLKTLRLPMQVRGPKVPTQGFIWRLFWGLDGTEHGSRVLRPLLNVNVDDAVIDLSQAGPGHHRVYIGLRLELA